MKTVQATQAHSGQRTPALRSGRLEPPVLALAALLLGGTALVVPGVAEARVTAGARTASAAQTASRPAPRISRAQASRRHAQAQRRSPRASRHAFNNAAASNNAAYVPVALAGYVTAAQFQGGPRAACLDATRRAEQNHAIPPGLLTAIALSESGLHAYAMSIGGRAVFPATAEAAQALLRATSGRSVMAGCLQVNARVHARGEVWPLDARLSAEWAGNLLARWGHEHGWADALRRWHGGSVAATPRLVCRVRAKLEITQPGSELFREFNCAPGSEDRTRRSGEAHFTTATIDSL